MDRTTGEIVPLWLVSDNGSAFKRSRFANFAAAALELRRVRTCHHAPELDGAVERFNSTLKYEHLHRRPIADAAVLIDEVDWFIGLYNTGRPHQVLGQRPPLEVYAERRP